jgi:signal transduction histidine kinase
MITAGSLTLIRDSKSLQNRWFFTFALLLGLWIAANFIDSNYINSSTVFFVKIDFILILFAIWSALVFACKFSGKTAQYQKLIIAPGFLINFVFGILIFLNLVIKSSINNQSLSISFLPFSIAYIILLLIYAIVFLGILLNKSLKSKGLEKSAINIILVGLTLALLANILTNLIFPLIIDSRTIVKDLNIIGYIGLLVMTVTIYIAITTQKLFNIRIVIARSVGYFLSLLIVLLIIVAPTIFLGTKIAYYSLPYQEAIYLIFITSLAIILFQPIKNIFNKLSNKIFYQNYYEIQDVIDKLGNLLVGSINPDDIRSKSIKTLSEAIKPKYISFALRNDNSEKNNMLLSSLENIKTNIIIVDELKNENNKNLINYLQDQEVGLVVRLRARHDDIGFMVFGLLQSGRSYSDRDIRLLSIASDEIAISLQNALRYQEIQNFNITLKEKITQATKDLTRANSKLKMLDETKDDFISMASHQLRTPLTSVKGYLSMVLEGDVGKLTKQQEQMLTQAFDSSQRMVYLISDLLNISRLQTGKFVIEKTSCDLSNVIDEEIGMVNEVAHARNIKINYNKPNNFSSINIDEIKTRQVIMNYLDNAIYYTPPGGEISVSLEDKQNTIELKVTDTGIGVPKSVVHHLFTKFYRADNAKKARPDGTGLGLFMAKKVIIAQGGSIIFSTKENKGSTFGFSLPKKG